MTKAHKTINFSLLTNRKLCGRYRMQTMCPVRTRPYMACPARFERATYALEAVKMSRNNKLNNGLKVLKSGV